MKHPYQEMKETHTFLRAQRPGRNEDQTETERSVLSWWAWRRAQTKILRIGGSSGGLRARVGDY